MLLQHRTINHASLRLFNCSDHIQQLYCTLFFLEGLPNPASVAHCSLASHRNSFPLRYNQFFSSGYDFNFQGALPTDEEDTASGWLCILCGVQWRWKAGERWCWQFWFLDTPLLKAHPYTVAVGLVHSIGLKMAVNRRGTTFISWKIFLQSEWYGRPGYLKPGFAEYFAQVYF